MRALIGLLIVAALVVTAAPATASSIAFEWTEGANSQMQSRHGDGGPVLADDFTPAAYGQVVSVEWWGTRALSPAWEITFHPDAGGLPDTAAATAILDQQFVVAPGADPDNDGIWHYFVAWPGPLTLAVGQDYWCSIANDPRGTPAGAAPVPWFWATPGAGPTVGTEQYPAAVSNQAPGNPHFGPWTSLPDYDFAFRINVVPEPGTVVVFGLGLGGLALLLRRRRD